MHRPLREIVRNINKAKLLCRCDSILLTGGEPTLHPQIFEIMDAAVTKGFSKIGFFSNATRFCDKKFVGRLLEHGMDNAMFSLHGSCARVHNRIVGSDNFKKALEGIKTALQLKIKTVINTVAVSANMRDMPAIDRLIQERFPDVLNHRISYPALMGDILRHSDLIPKYEDVIKVIKLLLNMPRRIPIKTELIPICLLGRNVELAEELCPHKGAGLVFDGVGSYYERAGGQPCLECRFNERCYGLQLDAVCLFGVPGAYGKIRGLRANYQKRR